MSERVLRTDDHGLCTLTLNRPEKLNALDTGLFEELDCHLAALERATDSIGCVVLRGAGRAFCAGADLTDIAATTVAFKPQVINRLAALPQPTIAAIHGVCFTGGLELALACDFLVGDSSARLADTHAKWGLVGAWGMIQRLPRRIGLPAAKRMMLTAREVGAAEAHRIGLLDILAGDEGLDAAVADLSGAILAASGHTCTHTKRILRETDGMPLCEALAWEQAHYPGQAPDSQDRIAAFGKR